jgi:hypothetical protein
MISNPILGMDVRVLSLFLYGDVSLSMAGLKSNKSTQMFKEA